MGLFFNLNFQSGLKFHSEVIIPDNDALKPALYQSLVEGFQVCGLLLDEILQFIDAGNLFVPDGSVNRAFFSLFPELEDFIGNLVVGLFAIGLFEKLFLKLLQFFVNAIMLSGKLNDVPSVRLFHVDFGTGQTCPSY